MSDYVAIIPMVSVMLAAMRMVFPSGDTKLMEFEDVRINPAIDESAFQPVTK